MPHVRKLVVALVLRVMCRYTRCHPIGKNFLLLNYYTLVKHPHMSTFDEKADRERREALRMARYMAVVQRTQAAIAAAEAESLRVCERQLNRSIARGLKEQKRQLVLEFQI